MNMRVAGTGDEEMKCKILFDSVSGVTPPSVRAEMGSGRAVRETDRSLGRDLATSGRFRQQ